VAFFDIIVLHISGMFNYFTRATYG